MEKTIKLGGNEYVLSSSVFTIIKYEQVFGNDIYDDISKLSSTEINITKIISTLTKILYILALPNFEKKVSYDKFISELPMDLFVNEEDLNVLTEAIMLLIPKQKGNTSVPLRMR